MYIDTYNTNNEDERFKKYVEILKSHDQLKKSFIVNIAENMFWFTKIPNIGNIPIGILWL